MSYPGLEFDEGSHVYQLNGVRLPSVTGVLSVISDYAVVPKAVLQKAADRGTAVHHATELVDAGTLDWGSLHDELIPYVMAWEQFKHDMRDRMQIVVVEKRTYHPSLGYAGTLDREVVLDDALSVIDIKSSVAMMPSVGPQLSAYMEAENAHRDRASRIKKRYGLQLKSNGKYKLCPYKETSDWQDFLAALRVCQFKERHKKGFDHITEIFSL